MVPALTVRLGLSDACVVVFCCNWWSLLKEQHVSLEHSKAFNNKKKSEAQLGAELRPDYKRSGVRIVSRNFLFWRPAWLPVIVVAIILIEKATHVILITVGFGQQTRIAAATHTLGMGLLFS